MAENGWGEAQPEEYIEAQDVQVASGQQATRWGNPQQPNMYLEAPLGQKLVPQTSSVQMGGGSGKQTGTVKTWIIEKGFGFITKPDGSDVFVHHSAVYAQGKASLEVGESVEFNLVISNDGRSKAEEVTGPGGVHVKGSSDSFGGGGGGATVCRNFQNSGACRFGMSCRFQHGSPGVSGSESYGVGVPSAYGGGNRGGGGSYNGGGASYGEGGGIGFGIGGKKPCFNYQNNGHCKFGDRCRFGHE